MIKNYSVLYFFNVTIAVFLLISCTPSEDSVYDDLSAPDIEISELFQISEDTLPDDLVFGRIMQLLVAESGEILIVDNQQHSIHLFDNDGTYLSSELTEGEGPGEVRQIGRVSLSNQNDLLLFDWAQGRLSHYRLQNDTQPELHHINDLSPDFNPREFHMTADGIIYVLEYPSPVEPDVDVIKLNKVGENGEADGDPVMEFQRDQIIELRNDNNQLLATTSSPHHRRTLFNFYEDRVMIGNSLRVGFEKYDLSTGERTDSVGFAQPDIPLTEAEKREFIEDITEQMGLEGAQISNLISQMPDTKGKVQILHYDPDGVVWMYLIGDDENLSEVWIALDENGEILGRITDMPEGIIMKAHSGRLYQLAESDTGEQMINVYSYSF
ncbi:6-bladed beta-propeller [Rhodohalobacter sp. SW132]|uniref:6-bladed beta-propeller n=1 Tax=Rhodohalobacter sp. SW132 TaxID=2293433 RepID=UPI000E2639D8|nr:6-bladed beta-propeller [Rhodohalobacter sp. SW132]REL37860.1 6-bladed beta-propeller [Rhodohalobacter sp. SW132]